MFPLISDAQFNSMALITIAVIGAIPVTLSAYWSRQAKRNSEETAREVRTNGGMSDPYPNVNDHIKYQTEMLEELVMKQANTDKLLGDHLSHSNLMDQALAEMYLVYREKYHPRQPQEED